MLWGVTGQSLQRNTGVSTTLNTENHNLIHNNNNNSANRHRRNTNNNHIQHSRPRRAQRQRCLRQSHQNNNTNRTQRQSYINQEDNIYNPKVDEWGDIISDKKEEEIFRIGFRNINGLPIDATHIKNYEIISDIRQYNFDLFGLTETNLAWHNLGEHNRIQDRMRGKLEFARIITAHNHDKEFTEQLQYGGCMTLSQGSITGRIINAGKDERSLGRWNWITIRGKYNTTLRIITLYRPVISNGSSSAYQQQKLHMYQKMIDVCPREQLFIDLQQDIDKWVEQGDRIIVQGDFNEDIRSNTITSFFQRWGMREIVLEKHGNNAPNTYRDGRVPIDGIFATPDITPLKCGYAPFHWGTFSDHRLLWAEFSLSSILGHPLPPLWNPKARRLKMIDSQTVQNFIHFRKQHYYYNDLGQRVKLVYDQIREQGITEESINAIEQIDQLRVEGILYADNKCRKIHAGEVPWSPAIQTSIARIRYLRVCIARLAYNRAINSRTLLKYYKASKFKTKVTNLEDARFKLIQEYATYKVFKKEAKERRATYLEELASKKAIETNANAESMLKVMIEHERQRELGRKLRRILGKPRVGVTTVEAPNNEGEWNLITDKIAVETACQEENIRRFTQANDTPTLLPSQVDLIGWTANTRIAQNILQGQQDPLLQPQINALVKYLQMPKDIRDTGCISSTITTEEFIKGWNKCREYTTTGKSGIHFGHFKASCLDPDLVEMDRCLLEISLITGYALTRWTVGIDVMIPKKADSIRVDKLRTIVLLEADFNFLNKIIGRRVMANAEMFNNIDQAQYGSRKEKSSILHATNKQLVFDIAIQQKQNTALVVLDAKSCYDRISPPVASICLQRQGAPQAFCDVMFHTIDKMSHFTRTSYGDSDNCYQHTQDSRFHGILQGNGAGPTIWATISSPLLSRLQDTGFGITITNPTTTANCLISAFSFVDDTDLIQQIPSTEDICRLPQQALNQWDESLYTTGGALVPEKCSWFLLHHHWQNNKWMFSTCQQKPGDLTIKEGDGNHVTIQRLEPTEAVLALGVMFSPSGNMRKQVSHLQEKAERWAQLIRVSGINRHETWYSLNTMIMKSLEYPLMATCMSEKELDAVMSTILRVGLSKSGICRTIARKAVFSSNRYFGFGIKHLHFTQGIAKLKLFLQPPTPITQHLIVTAWECTKIESGLGPSFLCSPLTKKISKYLTKGWIYCLWEFLTRYKVRMHVRNEEEIRYEGDSYLMCKLLRHPSINGDIKLFNICRIYLQVEKISDIITADGKRIRQHMWNGIRNETCQHQQWPHQPRPTQIAWSNWQRILCQVLFVTDSGVFWNPEPSIRYDIHWRWFFSPSEQRVYELSTEGIKYKPIYLSNQRQSRRQQLRFGMSVDIDTTPNDLVFCTLFHQDQFSILESISSNTRTITPPDSLDLWENSVRQTQHGDDEHFIAAWRTGKMVIVSDGSSKDYCATGAWILTSEELFAEGKLIEGTAISTGPNAAQDSHRAECFGLLGGLNALKIKLKEWEIDEGDILVACDNKSALHYTMDTSRYSKLKVSTPDFDVIMASRSLMYPKVKYDFQHVKGHQDDMAQELSFLAKLNVRMDLLAKGRREEEEISVSRRTRQLWLPNEHWQIAVGPHKVCKNFDQTIYDHASYQNMLSHWQKDNGNSRRKIEGVDWEGVDDAINKLPKKRQHWISKQVLGECGVNYILKRRKEKDSDRCKQCGEVETPLHIWKCRADSVGIQWQKAILDLRQHLDAHETCPDITEAITLQLQHWYLQIALPAQFQHPLIAHQEDIGWDFFIEGWLCKEWREYQNRYMQQKQSKKSVRRWISALILKLWEVAWDLWEHRNGIEHLHDVQEAHQNLDRLIYL